jgi:hypothetical protein
MGSKRYPSPEEMEEIRTKFPEFFDEKPQAKPAFPKRTGNFFGDLSAALDYTGQHGIPNVGPWSDKAIADYNQKQNMMKLGEFRPPNRKEQGLIRLLEKLKEKTDDFGWKNDPDGARRIRNNILRNFSEKDVSPQVASTRVRDEAKKVFDNWDLPTATAEVQKDFESIGYPKADPSWPWYTWDTANEAIAKGKPDVGYHYTPLDRISGITQEGLQPNKPPVNWNGANRDQLGKVFFSRSRNSAWKEPGTSLLRFKPPEDAGPDMYGGGGAWQTRQGIAPEALEIEISPDVWKPMSDLNKKRGTK